MKKKLGACISKFNPFDCAPLLLVGFCWCSKETCLSLRRFLKFHSSDERSLYSPKSTIKERMSLTLAILAYRLEMCFCQAFKTLLRFFSLAIKFFVASIWKVGKDQPWLTTSKKMFMFHPIIFKVKIDAFGYICGNFNDAWCMISHFRNQSKSCSVGITDCPRGRSEEPIFQQRRMLFVQVNFFPKQGNFHKPRDWVGVVIVCS